MDIINDYKNDKYMNRYALFVILSFITLKKVKKIELKKKELYHKIQRM